MTYRPYALTFIASATLMMGCGDFVEQELAEASVGSALSTSESTKMTRNFFRRPVGESCLDATAAAEEVAARPQVGLYPTGCVDKQASGPDVHAEYDGCTGPFGRVEIFGGIDAHFEELECNRLSAHIEDSGDLTGNGNLVEYRADADIEVEGELRFVDWVGHWSADTDRGRHVEHDAELDVVIDASTDCFTIGGGAHGTAGRWSLTSEIQDLTVCPEVCPASGTIDIVAEGPRREFALQVAFDGSDVATVTAEDGDVYLVDMVCAPAR